MTLINTINGEMDDSQLIRREDSFDEEIGTLTAVEYCLKGCEGPAHKSGERDTPEHFCSRHVHRSVNLLVKEGLDLSSLFENLV